MFYYLTWQFSDLDIFPELIHDMVPKLWNPDYDENNSMWAKMIFERRKNEELDKVFANIYIQLLFYYNSITFI